MLDIGCTTRPKCRAFLLFHKHQVETANNFFQKSSFTCRKQFNKSQKVRGGGFMACWDQLCVLHTASTSLQFHKACKTSSGPSLQSSHSSEEKIFRRTRLHLAGRALLQALQTKCLIFLGTRRCQIPLQNCFCGSKLELTVVVAARGGGMY